LFSWSSSISETIGCVPKIRGGSQELSANGQETLTLTVSVLSLKTAGVIVTVAVVGLTPALRNIELAIAVTSVAVLPLTIPTRAASNTDWSIACLTNMNRENSSPAKTVKNKTEQQMANSTVKAPRRLRFEFLRSLRCRIVLIGNNILMFVSANA